MIDTAKRNAPKHKDFYKYIEKDRNCAHWNTHSLLPRRAILKKDDAIEFYLQLVESYRIEHSYMSHIKIIAHLAIDGETPTQWFDRVAKGISNEIWKNHKKEREIAKRAQQDNYETDKVKISKLLPFNYVSLGMKFLEENPIISDNDLITKVIGDKPDQTIGKAIKRWNKRFEAIKYFRS